MIKVTVYKNPENEYIGLKTSGHAGFADSGEDIVCSAVSVLVINTINSIEAFTKDKFKVKAKDQEGLIEFKFQSTVSAESNLLMDSLVLGLQGIQEDYKKYIQIMFKEV